VLGARMLDLHIVLVEVDYRELISCMENLWPVQTWGRSQKG
jgi:hypothetical protein